MHSLLSFSIEIPSQNVNIQNPLVLNLLKAPITEAVHKNQCRFKTSDPAKLLLRGLLWFKRRTTFRLPRISHAFKSAFTELPEIPRHSACTKLALTPGLLDSLAGKTDSWVLRSHCDPCHSAAHSACR